MPRAIHAPREGANRTPASLARLPDRALAHLDADRSPEHLGPQRDAPLKELRIRQEHSVRVDLFLPGGRARAKTNKTPTVTSEKTSLANAATLRDRGRNPQLGPSADPPRSPCVYRAGTPASCRPRHQSQEGLRRAAGKGRPMLPAAGAPDRRELPKTLGTVHFSSHREPLEADTHASWPSLHPSLRLPGSATFRGQRPERCDESRGRKRSDLGRTPSHPRRSLNLLPPRHPPGSPTGSNRRWTGTASRRSGPRGRCPAARRGTPGRTSPVCWAPA